MRSFAGGVLFLFCLSFGKCLAQEGLSVCFNYGCLAEKPVVFGSAQLQQVADLMAQAGNAESERARLALAIGMFYRWAGEQSPIWADRGGNVADDGVDGRMDCIDHSTTTDRLLNLMDRRGWLRWHRVIDVQRRVRFVFQHFSAAIEAVGLPDRFGEQAEMDYEDAGSLPAGLDLLQQQQLPALNWRPSVVGRFVVDSWFFDHGKPAVILPLANWLRGEGGENE